MRLKRYSFLSWGYKDQSYAEWSQFVENTYMEVLHMLDLKCQMYPWIWQQKKCIFWTHKYVVDAVNMSQRWGGYTEAQTFTPFCSFCYMGQKNLWTIPVDLWTYLNAIRRKENYLKFFQTWTLNTSYILRSKTAQFHRRENSDLSNTWCPSGYGDYGKCLKCSCNTVGNWQQALRHEMWEE